ncbi:MAG TPA: tetratricopeptide repeat protein [Planctomycetota bacterium]|nr:tetratricopeptide repeat protein [Planctomycetota bacterium]
MRSEPARASLDPLRRLVQRRERPLILAWILGWTAVLGLFAWGAISGQADRAIERWEGRWTERVRDAERVFESGDFEAAAARLEALDTDFPAHFVKHRLDRERERVLELLGKSYVELGRERRALDALERLVAFDPRNFANHLSLADACARLGEPERAEAAYRAALAIHTSHLPALEALIGLQHDAARWSDVVRTFEGYVDAYVLARVTLSIDGVTLLLDVSADGREHRLESPLELPAGSAGEAELATGGWSVRVGELELEPPLRAGVAAAREPQRWPGESGWAASAMQEAGPGLFAAESASARLTRMLGPLPLGAARARLALTVYKALPPELWKQVETSYRNTLDHAGLEAARLRTLVGGCLEGGTIVVD